MMCCLGGVLREFTRPLTLTQTLTVDVAGVIHDRFSWFMGSYLVMATTPFFPKTTATILSPL